MCISLSIYIYIYRKAFMMNKVSTGQSSDTRKLPAQLSNTALRIKEPTDGFTFRWPGTHSQWK